MLARIYWGRIRFLKSVGYTEKIQCRMAILFLIVPEFWFVLDDLSL